VKLDLPLRSDLAGAADEARRLAELGAEGTFSYEGPGDVFFPLALAAGRADLDLYTNLAIALPRSPMHLAYAAWDLQSLTGGRFALGLGTQIRPHIERRYGSTWGRPVARMREIVGATKEIFRCWQEQDRLDFQGDFFSLSLMPPFFTPKPLEAGPPPIWLGGVGPNMTRMACETADGLLVHPFNSRRYVEERTVPTMREGLASSGRAREDFTLIAETVVCCWRTDEERARAEAGGRAQLAFYGSTPAYKPVLDIEGRGDLQPELNRLSKAGAWDEMSTLIDQTLLETVAVCGEPEAVAAELQARYGDVADRLAVSTPYEMAPDLMTDLVTAFHGAA